MSLYAFLHTTKPSLAFSFTVWLPPTGSRRACTETVYTFERETGLEPATACLEGRLSHNRRSIGLHRPYSRFYTVHMQCERAWQKMSRAFFTPFGKICHVFLPMMRGKSCCEHLETGGHTAVHIILSLYHHWQCFKGN